jgi:hypothetical protein
MIQEIIKGSRDNQERSQIKAGVQLWPELIFPPTVPDADMWPRLGLRMEYQ